MISDPVQWTFFSETLLSGIIIIIIIIHFFSSYHSLKYQLGMNIYWKHSTALAAHQLCVFTATHIEYCVYLPELLTALQICVPN